MIDVLTTETTVVTVSSVSVKRRHSVFDTQNFGQNAQKRKSASSDAKDFPVDAQFHMHCKLGLLKLRRKKYSMDDV